MEITLLLIEREKNPLMPIFIEMGVFIDPPNCEAHFTVGSGWLLILTKAPETPQCGG